MAVTKNRSAGHSAPEAAGRTAADSAAETAARIPAAKSLPGTKALGIHLRRSDSLVRMVRNGFRFDLLVSLERKSGLTRERIAQFAAIPLRTLARRQREGQLSPEESDRLLRASRVFEMAVELFEGDVPAARGWLLTPNPAIGGDSPLSFSSTDVGARQVEDLIGRLEHGIFV